MSYLDEENLKKDLIVKNELGEVISYLYDNVTYYRNKCDDKIDSILNNEVKELENSIKLVEGKSKEILENELSKIKSERGKNLMKKYSLLFSDGVLVKSGIKKKVVKKK
jgi:hypothetical protein